MNFTFFSKKPEKSQPQDEALSRGFDFLVRAPSGSGEGVSDRQVVYSHNWLSMA